MSAGSGSPFAGLSPSSRNAKAGTEAGLATPLHKSRHHRRPSATTGKYGRADTTALELRVSPFAKRTDPRTSAGRATSAQRPNHRKRSAQPDHYNLAKRGQSATARSWGSERNSAVAEEDAMWWRLRPRASPGSRTFNSSCRTLGPRDRLPGLLLSLEEGEFSLLAAPAAWRREVPVCTLIKSSFGR